MQMENKLYDNISEQLQEKELLESMYPDEIKWRDPTLYLDAQEFIQKKINKKNLRFLSFELHLKFKHDDPLLKTMHLNVTVDLPSMYPSNLFPDISVCSNELSRDNQILLNQDLKKYISELYLGELMLLDIFVWLKENFSKYGNSLVESPVCAKHISNDNKKYMCLYMHHIYNKEKRKNILNWAREFGFTGFSLPGKPGVVYVEGDETNIDTYFESLRKLKWQKITCKLKGDCLKRKFDTFEEISFGQHGTRSNHMDMGKFFIYLKERQLQFIFKEVFGFDGQI